MTREAKRRWISPGLLVAVALGTAIGGTGSALQALGINAAHAAEGKAAAAKPEGGEATDGWLYLGRRRGDGWRPASSSIAHPRYPLKRGGRVTVKQDALVYGSVDCKVIDAAEFKADGTSRSVLLVKADQAALEVLRAPIECPSIGRAKTVWVNVKIPAARLVSTER